MTAVQAAREGPHALAVPQQHQTKIAIADEKPCAARRGFPTAAEDYSGPPAVTITHSSPSTSAGQLEPGMSDGLTAGHALHEESAAMRTLLRMTLRHGAKLQLRRRLCSQHARLLPHGELPNLVCRRSQYSRNEIQPRRWFGPHRGQRPGCVGLRQHVCREVFRRIRTAPGAEFSRCSAASSSPGRRPHANCHPQITRTCVYDAVLAKA